MGNVMIVLGCDVGASTGIALLDCTGARPRFVSCEVVREDLTATVSALFVRHPIAAVGIETPAQVFEHGRAKDNEGARRSIERALLVARDAAGVVRATTQIQGRGAKVHDGQAHNIRRAVLGKLPKQHVDRFIASRLPLLIEGWPARSNNHERDAAVVALWAWQRERAGESTMPRVGKSMDRKATLRRMRGETQVYHAAQGQKAASSAARGRAEAAFAKVTGKGVKEKAKAPVRGATDRVAPTPAGSEDATPRMLVPCATHGAAIGKWCFKKPDGVCAIRKRLAGLAVAGARVLGPKPATGPKKKAQRIPEDLAAMRAQARSVACPVPGCLACIEAIVMPGTDRACTAVDGEPFAYGVHASRARAAELPPFPCAADLDAGAKPIRAKEICETCDGAACDDACSCRCHRGSWTWLPGRGAEVWLILPWNIVSCGDCDGCGWNEGGETLQTDCRKCGGTGRKAMFTHTEQFPDPPPERAIFAVPAHVRAEWGRTVTLHRTTFTTRPKGEQPGRLAWLFTMKDETRTT